MEPGGGLKGGKSKQNYPLYPYPTSFPKGQNYLRDSAAETERDTPKMPVASARGALKAAVAPLSSSSTTHLRPYLCFDLSGNGLFFNRPNNTTRNLNLRCRCSSHSNSSSFSSSSNWDWNRWTHHFAEIEQAENIVSLLKFQLEDAIEKEEFHEAGKLKTAIAEATSKDTVAEIICQLKNAVDEERYRDASRLSKLTGSGLIGWWVGFSKDSDEPFGLIVQITPGIGRFIARSYTSRQLVTASPGTPLFEVFVVKEADQTYSMQVVFLQQVKGSSTDYKFSPFKPTEISLIPKPEKSSVSDIQGKDDSVTDGNEEKNTNIKDASNILDPSEEAIKSVINLIKDKIPGLKMKVTNVTLSEESTNNTDSMEQLVQEDDETSSSADDSHVADTQKDIEEEVHVGAGPNTKDVGNNVATKLVIGGLLHNRGDTPSKEDYARFPAEIKNMDKNSFELHISERYTDTESGKCGSTFKAAANAMQNVAFKMPREVAQELFSSRGSPRVPRDVQDILKLGLDGGNRLPKNTSFSRINTSKDDLDPFDGLYVGSFSAMGSEVVQLKRKYGNWNDANDTSDVEFFEYVEVVKLTGNLDVPAGEVAFRAKIGKGNQNSKRGAFSDILALVSSYDGQGRVADFGFENPQWVEGELLQLSSKGIWPHIGGGDVGLIYLLPEVEQSFLVLLTRLKLPE